MILLPFLLALPIQAPLYEIEGLGSGAANLGDLDGYGVSDFLLGSQVLSGATLLAPPAPNAFLEVLSSFGPPPGVLALAAGGLAVLDHLDGDGLGEIAGGWTDISRCPGDSPRFTTETTGGVGTIFSSLGGIHRGPVFGLQAGKAFGGIVARLGDLGDGRPEVEVGSARAAAGAGKLQAFSSPKQGHLRRR